MTVNTDEDLSYQYTSHVPAHRAGSVDEAA
jgi:hypothetical protein